MAERKILSLRLDKINLESCPQPRAEWSQEHIDNMLARLQEGSPLNGEHGGEYPVVYWDGHVYHMADGRHRHAVYAKAGRKMMDVEVFQGQARDAFLYSVSCGGRKNLSLTWTNKDKRHAIGLMLDHPEFRTWSPAAIAEGCGERVGLVRIVIAERRADEARKAAQEAGKAVDEARELAQEADARRQSSGSPPMQNVYVPPEQKYRLGRDGKPYPVDRPEARVEPRLTCPHCGGTGKMPRGRQPSKEHRAIRDRLIEALAGLDDRARLRALFVEALAIATRAGEKAAQEAAKAGIRAMGGGS